MRKFLRRLLGRAPVVADDIDHDFSWMFPPDTVTDPGAWDQYWRDQLANEAVGFVDMFCDDGELVDAMRASNLRTVLCVGSGLSQEPRALAWAGFDVTALDLSPLATEVQRQAAPPPDYLANLVGGRSQAANGELRFVVGDLCDSGVCPGPFDVVIDRKTLQLYPEHQLPTAMDAVATRLAVPGVFFSHCHDGGWRPPEPPKNPTEDWFKAQGWRIWHGEGPLTQRVAWVLTSTG